MNDSLVTPKASTGDKKPTYVFVTRVRCPFCGSASLTSYRSTACSDGSTMRHTACNECFKKFRVVEDDE